MIIQKYRLCLTEIEAFVDCWDQPIVGDLENGEQANAEHVGQFFEVSFKSCLLKRIKGTTIGVQNWIYALNTKEKQTHLIWNWAKTK